MFAKKIITMLAVLVFSFFASLAVGKGVPFRATDIERSVGTALGTLNLASIVLAQNDKTAPDENGKSQSGSETDESEPAADDKNKSSNAKSKPLKPFVPSEKIPGDQAVDFPVDI